MSVTKFSPEEVAHLGNEIYHRDIRNKVMPQHKGEFLILDIQSGDYEIDTDDLSAEEKLRVRQPDGIFFGLRIGYTSAYTLAGRMGQGCCMITGVVNAQLEATIALRILGLGGQFWDSQTVIDTGYNGFITLPMSVVTTLSLPKGATREVTLGDTSRKVFDYYSAEVMWDGQPHKVRVLCVEGDPLIGTALLAGYKLEADFVVGGSVTLELRS